MPTLAVLITNKMLVAFTLCVEPHCTANDLDIMGNDRESGNL